MDTDLFDFDDFDLPELELPGLHWVDSYVKGDGTFVSGHWKTFPDGILPNNLSH